MRFTDIFIRRPVLASVVSLLILIVGLRSITSMEVRQYPETKDTVVTITTSYPGASGDLVKAFITAPLQQAVAEADGIDYLTSTSVQGQSTIDAHMVLNYDPKSAVAEIQAKVASQRNVLPREAEDPVIDATTGDPTALMYMAFYSKAMDQSQITDYLLRVVQPQLQAVPGVAKAGLIGNRTYAMRVWLDPRRMAALGVTAADIEAVLLGNNYLAGVGGLKDHYFAVDLSADTDVSREEDFRRLVVRSDGQALVRLEDVARIELGAQDYDTTTLYRGIPAIFVGIEQAPGANPLTVAGRVHEVLPDLRAQFPEGLSVVIPYDASVFIQDSIREVFTTLAEAVLIVLLVIFLTLGSLRAALIPAVAVPLSLIGGAIIMLALGYSINLLTLLAMVLAIGLVVDDAIVVVENIHRHIEEGMGRTEAALQGARELAVPVIAMTTTLVAVYAPIGFMGGLVGTLFTEFAFSLAAAVLVSGVVALTLSPMLSGKVLKPAGQAGPFERGVERFFTALANGYGRSLHGLLRYPSTMLVFAVAILVAIWVMFVTSRSELAPTEDQSILFFQALGPQTATTEYATTYVDEILKVFQTIPEYKESFILAGMGGDPSVTFGGFKMPSARERDRSQMTIMPELQGRLKGIAGVDVAVFPRPSLPGAGRGLPMQFVLTTDADFEELDDVAGQLLGRAMGSGKFLFLRKSVDINRPRTRILIDRDRAGDLGVSMRDIGRNLSLMLGEGYVNRFSLEGRSYQVIPQVARADRLDPAMLDDYYVRAAGGDLVPLGSLVRFEDQVEPSKRTQFQQLNSLNLEGIMAPGVTLGDAIAYLEQQAREVLPRGYGWDFVGQARQYSQQGSALVLTFFMSLLVIYLVLAAQFESWRDPLIILVSVPMSIFGAVAFLTLGFASVNIYTQVGLITLIGLVAKNGILIVEFANQVREHRGLPKAAAVEEAARIRLRPILMTSVSMVVAMVPLLLARGPGAVSRFDIGLVIAAGLGIGTLFTLYVVPAFYMLLAPADRPDAETDAETAGAAALSAVGD
jgi:multidrug efflux pump